MRYVPLHLLALLSFIVLLPQCGFTQEALQSRIERVTLSNGLRAILCPRGTSPLTACVTYVNAGALDERGTRGLAVLFDRMAFNGTRTTGTKNLQQEFDIWAQMDRIDLELQGLISGASYLDYLRARTAALPSGKGLTDRTVERWSAAHAPTGEMLEQVRRLTNDWFLAFETSRTLANSNEYRQALEQRGARGVSNFVNADRTLAVCTVPSNALELWCALEADRLANWQPRGLEMARQAALREYRLRTQSNAFGRLHQHFLATVFHRHPYGQGSLGEEVDLLQIRREDLLRFQAEALTPDRTVLSFVGQFEVAVLKPLLEKYFGALPRRAVRRILPAPEPPQEGERRFDLADPSGPICMLGFRIPRRAHPDAEALRMLREFCSPNAGSRFHQALLKTRLAHTLQTWIGPGLRDECLLTIGVEPFDGISLDELETHLLKEVERLHSEPPSEEELRQAAARIRSERLTALESPIGLGTELAEAESLLGDWRRLFVELENATPLQSSTFSNVLGKYLIPKNRTIARLVSTTQLTPEQLMGRLQGPGVTP